jgi:1-pyrroline-5-carboxylate dehydrogenase
MSNAYFIPPGAYNQPVMDHAKGSPERKDFEKTLSEMKKLKVDVPMYIGAERVFTDNKVAMRSPYDLSQELGTYSKGDAKHVKAAIDAAMKAKKEWENTPWQERAAIFLKAADLLVGPYRSRMNAATMMAQSKNIHQSEIDAICELADFWRFNVQFMAEIYENQPNSDFGIWNRTEYRPLEGFVFAITPFNFTAIAGNLPTAPAMMGNTVVWKAAESQIYSANLIMEILLEAGLPPGVINFVHVRGPVAGDVILSHPDFGGLHFTGSTGVFRTLWKTIGENIETYRSYPRIVGETGGKDFVLAHKSADKKALVTALVRGAYEFQGQKCSAASRAYIPKSIWPDVKEMFLKDLSSVKMGSPEDFTNFVNAVIDEKAFDKIKGYIDKAAEDSDAEIIAGGGADKSKGYFVEPTAIVTKDPKYSTMCEEIFGPVLTIYVYDDNQFDEVLKLVDNTSPYALTGAVFAKDRYVINKATKALRHSAGNFYINDKPTGAVVGQQPFGGARGSGTNDKAGDVLNLYRWVSQRTLKETFNPPKDYRYPFMG